MRRFNIFCLLCAICYVLVGGCATPYRATGFQGGFSEEWVAKDTVWIGFEGNTRVDAKTLEQSLRRRAAELTLEHGYTHFLIVNQTRQAGLSLVLRPGVVGPAHQMSRAIQIRCSYGEPGAIAATTLIGQQSL